MKKVFTSLLLLHCHVTSHSQHILNPYEDFTNQAISVPFPKVENQANQLVYNSYLPGFGNGYTGEYMIAIREHPFSPFYNNALTYKIETVSFPFTLNCFNDPGNCAYPVLPEFERNMTMPDEPYDAVRKVWGGSTNLKEVLFNVRENGEIELGAGYAGARWSGSDGIPDGLVSLSFYSSTPNFQDYLHPHTVLKHTVYLHCSSSYTSPVIDSIVWIYDNTRGRMRNYPFKNSNQPGGSAISHDVVFMPQVISKTEADHYYNETENGAWYPGGTINYFPFDNQSWNSVCSANAAYFPSQDFEEFRYYDNGTNTYSDNYGYTAPYALNACFLRDGNGSTPAGYKIDLLNTNNITIPSYHYGIKHTYYIDRSIDLSVINPDEKVIYNPSEVIVDPDAGNPQANNAPIEIVFPAGYTFKTILGRYPSYQQVQDAKNDPQNGWAYLSDERQVPVPVNAADLPPSPGTNPAVDYPEVMWDDPNTPVTDNFYNDERYGYYYLQDKSTVKVERCVKIYDARFVVNQGAALVFDDYSQLLGFENKTINGANNYGRIKIRGTGGAVLRNNAEVQYVQNGIISQPHPLHYKARQILEAGDAVDPDTDQPQGNYDVQTGADVTFEAGDVIHLTNGFQVSGGSFSAFTNTNIPDFPVCYDAQRIMSNQPKDYKPKPQAIVQDFTIAPNPSSTGIFNIRFRNLPANGELSVFNSMGAEVKRMDNIQQTSLTVSVEGMAKGIYMFRYREGAEKYQTIRVVFQ